MGKTKSAVIEQPKETVISSSEKKVKGGKKAIEKVETPIIAPIVEVAAPIISTIVSEPKEEKKVKTSKKAVKASAVDTTLETKQEEVKEVKEKKASKAKKESTKEETKEIKEVEKKRHQKVKKSQESQDKQYHYYKIIVDGEKDEDDQKNGRFEGSKPKQAGNKAFTTIGKIYAKKGLELNPEGNIFKICECTRGYQTVEYDDGTSKSVPIGKRKVRRLENGKYVDSLENKIHYYVGIRRVRKESQNNIIEINEYQKLHSWINPKKKSEDKTELGWTERYQSLIQFIETHKRLPEIVPFVPLTEEQKQEKAEMLKKMSKEEKEKFLTERKEEKKQRTFERGLVNWINLQNFYFKRHDNNMADPEVFKSWKTLLSGHPLLEKFLDPKMSSIKYSYIESAAPVKNAYEKLKGTVIHFTYTRSETKAKELKKQPKTYTEGKLVKAASKDHDYDVIILEDSTELKRFSYNPLEKQIYSSLNRDIINIKYTRNATKAEKFGGEQKQILHAKVLMYKENKFGKDEPHLLLLEDGAEAKKLEYNYENKVIKWVNPLKDCDKVESPEKWLRKFELLKSFLSTYKFLPNSSRHPILSKEEKLQKKLLKDSMTKEQKDLYTSESKKSGKERSLERTLEKWIRFQNYYFERKENVMANEEKFTQWKTMLSTTPGLDKIVVDTEQKYSFVHF